MFFSSIASSSLHSYILLSSGLDVLLQGSHLHCIWKQVIQFYAVRRLSSKPFYHLCFMFNLPELKSMHHFPHLDTDWAFKKMSFSSLFYIVFFILLNAFPYIHSELKQCPWKISILCVPLLLFLHKISNVVNNLEIKHYCNGLIFLNCACKDIKSKYTYIWTMSYCTTLKAS